MYDIPAFIDKMLDETGKSQIIYTGFSNGNIQFTAALMQMEESYFAHAVEKAIYQAPCIYVDDGVDGVSELDYYKSLFVPLKDRGVVVIGSPDEDIAAAQLALACDGLSTEEQA